MRIFNGTNSSLNLPLTGSERLSVGPKSPSGDFLANNEFLSMVTYSYHDDEIALIVSGPYELNMCANIPAVMSYVVQSIDEAIERFAVPAEESKSVEEKIEEALVEDSEKTEPVVENEGAVVDDPKEEEEADELPTKPKKIRIKTSAK